MLARKLKENVENTENVEERLDDDFLEHVPGSGWLSKLEKVPLRRASTLKLQMEKEIPYRLSPDIVAKADKLNVDSSKERACFEPGEVICGLCGHNLGSPVYPQGCDSSGGNGILLTCTRPFQRIDIKLKKCLNPSCGASNLLFPLDIGRYPFIVK